MGFFDSNSSTSTTSDQSEQLATNTNESGTNVNFNLSDLNLKNQLGDDKFNLSTGGAGGGIGGVLGGAGGGGGGGVSSSTNLNLTSNMLDAGAIEKAFDYSDKQFGRNVDFADSVLSESFAYGDRALDEALGFGRDSLGVVSNTSDNAFALSKYFVDQINQKSSEAMQITQQASKDAFGYASAMAQPEKSTASELMKWGVLQLLGGAVVLVLLSK